MKNNPSRNDGRLFSNAKRNVEKFTSKLRNIQETKFPIVKAAFKGKDVQIYIGVMMIDTGGSTSTTARRARFT